MVTSDIDIVILWVDGNDPKLISEKQRYSAGRESFFADVNRQRDWGIFRYVFRGVEAYLPWVRRIYLVTSFGQCPPWLNVTHDRLRIVDVEEFMPSEVLPTFNSNSIQLCIHKLPGLSERFILWDDDMFAISPMKPDDFFHGGLPCTQIGFARLTAERYDDTYAHSILNDVGVINQNFDFRVQLRKWWRKWLSLRNGIDVLLRNVGYIGPMDRFFWAYYPHMPQGYLRKTFEDIWYVEHDIMGQAITHRFRSKEDLTHKLMRYWQIASGEVVPRNTRSYGRLFLNFPEEIEALRRVVYRSSKKLVCINDSNVSESMFEYCCEEIKNILNYRLPDMSAYEKLDD